MLCVGYEEQVIARGTLCLLLPLAAVACGAAQGPQYHYSSSWKGGATRSMPLSQGEAAAAPVTEPSSSPAARQDRQDELPDASD